VDSRLPEKDAAHGPATAGGAEVAVALRYDASEGAPRVTASGEGLVARNIEALAEQAGVPLYRDPQLARLLAQVDLGDEIPRALYVAVAEVIAFVWSLREDTACGGTGAAAGDDAPD
jgi:flagellar biosynthesis protein